MSWTGYTRKTKPALWTQSPEHQAQEAERDEKKQARRRLRRNFLAEQSARRKREMDSLTRGLRKVKPSEPSKWLAKPRRQKVNREYSEKAKAFVAAAVERGWTCPVVALVKVAFPDLRKYGHRPCNRLNEVHHSRGRLGPLLMDMRFWIPLSKFGHRWCHEHPAWARANGFLCAEGKWNTVPEDGEEFSVNVNGVVVRLKISENSSLQEA